MVGVHVAVLLGALCCIGLAVDAGQALPDAFWDPLPDEMSAALAGQVESAMDALR